MRATILGAQPPDAGTPLGDGEFDYQPATPPHGLSWEQIGELATETLFMFAHRPTEGVQGGICDHFGDWGRIGLRVCRVKDPNGGFLEAVRAGMVRVFLRYAKRDSRVKYLVMCDNDQSIDVLAPILLARHDKPIVSGVVCGFSEEKGVFACFTVKGKDGAAYFPSTKGTKVMPAKGLVKAHQVGTGLVCIRKDVLETIVAGGDTPFWIPESIRKEAALTGDLRKSEDICFSDQCDMYGFERFVDLEVHAVHYKQVGISWAVGGKVDPNMSVDDWDVSSGCKVGGDIPKDFIDEEAFSQAK